MEKICCHCGAAGHLAYECPIVGPKNIPPTKKDYSFLTIVFILVLFSGGIVDYFYPL